MDFVDLLFIYLLFIFEVCTLLLNLGTESILYLMWKTSIPLQKYYHFGDKIHCRWYSVHSITYIPNFFKFILNLSNQYILWISCFEQFKNCWNIYSRFFLHREFKNTYTLRLSYFFSQILLSKIISDLSLRIKNA